MNNNENKEAQLPDGELGENGDSVPARTQAITGEFISSFIAQFKPSYHPLLDRFEPDHITLFLKNSHEKDLYVERRRNSNRNYALIYFLCGGAVFVFLAYSLLPDNSAIFFEILKAAGFLTAGGFGGYGIHAYRTRSRVKDH